MRDLLLWASSFFSNWIDLKFRQPTGARFLGGGCFKAPDVLLRKSGSGVAKATRRRLRRCHRSRANAYGRYREHPRYSVGNRPTRWRGRACQARFPGDTATRRKAEAAVVAIADRRIERIDRTCRPALHDSCPSCWQRPRRTRAPMLRVGSSGGYGRLVVSCGDFPSLNRSDGKRRYPGWRLAQASPASPTSQSHSDASQSRYDLNHSLIWIDLNPLGPINARKTQGVTLRRKKARLQTRLLVDGFRAASKYPNSVDSNIRLSRAIELNAVAAKVRNGIIDGSTRHVSAGAPTAVMAIVRVGKHGGHLATLQEELVVSI